MTATLERQSPPIRQAVEREIALMRGPRELYVKTEDGTFVPATDSPSRVLTVRMTPALYERLRERADVERLSMNKLAVLAIEQQLAELAGDTGSSSLTDGGDDATEP